MTIIIDGTNGITSPGANLTANSLIYPSWTTAGRPSSPVTGTTGYNTSNGGLEIYNGSAWSALNGGPAFSAYQSAAQTIGSSFAKMQFQSETFDTNSCFDSSTNYRFTPTVAGYYFVTAQIWSSAGATSVQPAIYKNGAVAQYGAYLTQTSQISGLISMNGSTDYLEIYGYLSSSGTLSTGAERNFFQGYLARGV